MEEKEIKNPSETVEGGRYIVNGVYVNAEGEVLADQAELTPKPEKVEKAEAPEKAKDR